MRALLLLLLTMPAVADDWWIPTSKSLPDLLDEGYVLVGFSSDTPAMGVGSTTSHRYILSKDTVMAFCYEHVVGGKTRTKGCVLSVNSLTQ